MGLRDDRFYCIEKDAQGNPLKKYMKNILPDSIKEEFDRKDLLCCEYLNLTETQEREIFQRVQLGIPLTAAEKVRATAGAWQEFAQSFELDFPRVVNRKCTIRRVWCHSDINSDNQHEGFGLPSHPSMLLPDLRDARSNIGRWYPSSQAFQWSAGAFLQATGILERKDKSPSSFRV